MEQTFEAEMLREKLAGMNRWKTLAFGLTLCERMLPSFTMFNRETGYAGGELLRASTDKAWSLLESGVDRCDLSHEAHECAEVAPDADDYDTLHTSAALDAAVAVSSLMDAFADDAVKPVVEIATLACDTIDMLVQVNEGWTSRTPDREGKILSHPLMQSELLRQRRDIEFLGTLSGDLTGTFAAIENRWRSASINIIGMVP